MAQYEIRVSATAECALHIEGVGHPDDEVHGRSLALSAAFAGPELDSHGFLADERKLRAMLGEVAAGLDHKHLNRLPQFSGVNPSAENIARWVAEELQKRLPADGRFALKKVSVGLHRDAKVTYRL
jgi:6-pyruvoyltetrahydropterin/6-carboxytetrahydropterin synthase